MGKTETCGPEFLFRGNDLLNLLTYWWQFARIFDLLQEIEDREPDPDPMEDADAMFKLRQKMADHLMNLTTRDDGTTSFEEGPLIFVGSNSHGQGGA